MALVVFLSLNQLSFSCALAQMGIEVGSVSCGLLPGAAALTAGAAVTHTETAARGCEGHVAEQQHLVRLARAFLPWTRVLPQRGTEM